MKKSVIKRRKRVPAAGGAQTSPSSNKSVASIDHDRERSYDREYDSSSRMSDQAAAEALVAVGMAIAHESASGEDEERVQPRRKRARKSTGVHPTAKRSRMRGDGARTEDEDDGREESESPRMRPRHPIPSRAASYHGHHHHHHTLHSHQTMSHHGHPYSHHPHGHHLPGFDLPPISFPFIMGPSGAATPGTAQSYIRSGSGAPSRAESPVQGAQPQSHGGTLPSGGLPSGYVLPPPHGMFYAPHHGHGHSHGHSYPHSHSHLSSLAAAATSGADSYSSGVPTVSELERHYCELSEQRKRLEEMVEKTERMMAGVKRGLDDMRGHGDEGEAEATAASPAASHSGFNGASQEHQTRPHSPARSPLAQHQHADDTGSVNGSVASVSSTVVNVGPSQPSGADVQQECPGKNAEQEGAKGGAPIVAAVTVPVSVPIRREGVKAMMTGSVWPVSNLVEDVAMRG
jgi:GATA-binding protein